MNAPKGEETIFAEALRLPPEERAAYVAQATSGNPALRQEVESLLHGYVTGDFLEVAAASELRPTLHVTVPIKEKAGDTIGRYKLLQQIGEGGCGIVYMAEQSEPVRRRVALKIIKLGMDTKSVIARFEAERQALALMDHPNIAKVFDAGATETGRPYFVMELVRGMKITEFCDEKKLPTKQRLDLFAQVCQAIQHAHQKGIIHRDIKPSNILVSVNDGVAMPKIIDFGIAKATSGQQLTDKTLFTAFEQFIGTPAYMSPEQAMITNVDIDTRSDIYALGVLLYELLTGKTPFDAKELLAIGLDEMRRTIREQEPQRPSTRLSTLAQNELSTTAQRRGLDAPKLVSELRGDLDWIVMKALEKDRARRYETANGLAADVQRHLSNEPVVACPPSRVYRLQKLVRRNKLAFCAAAAVVTALVAGAMVTAWQARRAKAERDSAEAVLNFFRDHVLVAARPEGREGGLGKDATLRQAIDTAETNIATAFQNRPLVEAAIRATIAESYRYLGEPTLAIQQSERALALRRQHLGIRHPATLSAMSLLAFAYRDAGKYDQALPLLEETLKLRKARLGSEHPNTLSSMNSLALVYSKVGKRDQALGLFEETLKLRKARLGSDHPDTLVSMDMLAATYRDAGKLDKALPLQEETFRLAKTTLGPEHPDTLVSMHNLALMYMDTGKLDQALPLQEQAFRLNEAKLGREHPQTLQSMQNLALNHYRARKLDQAVPLFEEALRLMEVRLGTDHPETRNAANNLALAYGAAGKRDQLEALYRKQLTQRSSVLTARIGLARLLMEAAKTDGGDSGHRKDLVREGEQLLREYLAAARNRYTNDPLKLAERLYDVADLHYRHGSYAEAEPLYRELVQYRSAGLKPDHKDVLDATASLARLCSDWAWAERDSKSEMADRAREGARLLREVLAVRLRDSTNSWRVGDVKSRLGGALLSVAVTDSAIDAESRRDKLSEAETLLLEAGEQLRTSSAEKKYKRDALERIVRLYQAWNKPDKRVEWQQKLERFDKAQTKSPASESPVENTFEADTESK